MSLHHSNVAKGAVMDSPCSKKRSSVVGGLLYVVLSMLFGSLWYAALSLAMARLRALNLQRSARPAGKKEEPARW
jgi:hypothetical protein